MNSNTPLFERMLADYAAVDPRWQADAYWQEILGPVCESFKNPADLSKFRSSPLRTGIRSILPSNPGYRRRLAGRGLKAKELFSMVPGFNKIINYYEETIKIIIGENDDMMKRWLTCSYLLLERAAGAGKTLPDKMVGKPDDYVTIEGKNYSFYSLGYQYLYWRAQELIGWQNVKTVLELGSGYGGQAEVVALNSPHVKYVCVDIPHWLYVNEMYLSTLFPGQVMGYEETSKIDGPIDIVKEMGSRKFALIPAWKFHHVDSKFDLFWNSKSLQEMDEATIISYGSMIKKMVDKTFLHAYHEPKPPAFDHEALRKLFVADMGYTLKVTEKDHYAGKNSVNMVFTR